MNAVENGLKTNRLPMVLVDLMRAVHRYHDQVGAAPRRVRMTENTYELLRAELKLMLKGAMQAYVKEYKAFVERHEIAGMRIQLTGESGPAFVILGAAP